jgi:hypothetical protein
MASNAWVVRRRGVVIAGGAWLLSGCFGSFGATHALYDWNKRVDDNKWLRWLVFLVFVILPVYSLFILADVLVLNTIEFFSGKNPIGSTALGNGHVLRTSHTADPALVKHELLEHTRVVDTLYMRLVSPDSVLVYDAQMRVIGQAHKRADGSVELRNAADHVISLHSRTDVENAQGQIEVGASPSRAVGAFAGRPLPVAGGV